MPGPRRHGERGSITLYASVITFSLLLLIGIVVDLGAKLRAGREAANVAEEAARAGAGQVDRDRAYARGGRFVVDRAAALRAARAYLSTSGHSGTVGAVGSERIRVSVQVTKPTVLLSLIGINSVDARGTATADLVQGVEGPV